jgi:hypothetical protein
MQSKDITLLNATPEQLIEALRANGYVVSAWYMEDLFPKVDEDPAFEHLSMADTEEAARSALDELETGLVEVLAQRGNDYIDERWENDVKETILKQFGAASPKA